jgi:predicted  nucleic acid-binding Zn-ribbon protein
MKKLKSVLFVVSLMLSLGFVSAAMAEEATTADTSLPAELESLVSTSTTVSSEAVADENISDKELGTSEITAMPSAMGNLMNSLKQKISLAFTFDKAKSIEKHLQFANEKMARARYMLANAKDRRTYDNALDQLNKAKDNVDEIKDKISEIKLTPERLKELQDKYSDQLILHHRILEKLENQVPADVLEKIKANREEHLDRLKEVFEKIDANDAEKVTARLRRAFENEKGSALKSLTDLQFIEELKAKYPENKKEIFDRIMALRHEELAKKLNFLTHDERTKKIEEYLSFANTDDPAIKTKMLAERQELLDKLSEGKSIDPLLKSSMKQAMQFMAIEQKKLIQLEEKAEKLEEKMKAGDEKAKELFEKLGERKEKIKEVKEKIINDLRGLKPLPAFDETKVNQNGKPLVSDDVKKVETTTAPTIKIEGLPAGITVESLPLN